MKRILFLLVFVSLFPSFISSASANCVTFENGGSEEYAILESWRIEHVRDKNATGCLAKIYDGKNERLVYTPYSYICKLAPQEKISLSLESSCCDTGRDGDYPCGIKPQSSATGIAPNVRISLTAVPEELDSRALPDLVSKLEGEEIYGIRSVADKLAQYAEDDNFSEDVRAYAPRLHKVHDSSENAMQKEAIAIVLLALEDDTEKADIHLLLSRIESAIAHFDEDQLDILEMIAKRPESAKTALPVLIRLLDRINDPEPIMKIFTQWDGAVIAPYFRDIAGAIGLVELIEAQEAVHAADFNALPEGRRRELTEIAVKADDILPLWEEIICGYYPGHDRVDWDKYNLLPAVNCN